MRIPQKYSSFILPGIALVGLSLATIHVAKTHEAPKPLDPPEMPSRAPFSEVIAGAGLIEPQSENIKVGTLVPGIVTEVLVEAGQQVKKGDVLFRIDNRAQLAEREIRAAQLAMAESQLVRLKAMPRAEDVPVAEALVMKARADVKARTDLLNRGEKLLSQGIETQEEFIQRQQSLESMRADQVRSEAELARLTAGAWKEDLLVQEAQVKQARAQLSSADIDLDRLVVRAPIDGTILKVDVRPGEYVGTPPNQTLIMLGDLSSFHVRVDIDENDLPRFRTGLPGQGFIRGDAKQPLELKFVRVERLAEPKKSLTGAGNERVDVRVLQVIYRILPTKRPIYVGQQIDVYLNASEGADVATSPARP